MKTAELYNVSNYMLYNSLIIHFKSLHIKLIHLSVTVYIETSHLILIVNQLTGSHMKCNTGLKLLRL